jgi:hypothetical protein
MDAIFLQTTLFNLSSEKIFDAYQGPATIYFKSIFINSTILASLFLLVYIPHKQCGLTIKWA